MFMLIILSSQHFSKRKLILSVGLDIQITQNHEFKFQDYVWNGCHDLMMLCLRISNIAIITVTGLDYCCIIYDISKSEEVHLLQNTVLEYRGYM